jgi:methylase of polypeptide subunit release factors
MAAVVERAPRAGRMLEVGCGHGLFANEAALRNPRLEVLAIDPSPDKVRWAEATAAGRDNIRFRLRLEAVAETASTPWRSWTCSTCAPAGAPSWRRAATVSGPAAACC